MTTFKTGRKFPLGNGSVLVLLGQRPLGEDVLCPSKMGSYTGKEVYFLAQFVCERQPPRNASVNILRMHTNAVLAQLRAHIFVPTYEPKIALLEPVDSEGWVTRLIFRRCLDGAVINAERYSHDLASYLERCWRAVQHVEYKWKGSNRDVEGEYPLLPQDIRFNATAQKVSGEYERVARDLIAHAHCLGPARWYRLSTDIAELRKLVSGIEPEVYREQLKEMVRASHLSLVDGYYVFRETLIVACWKGSVGELSHLS